MAELKQFRGDKEKIWVSKTRSFCIKIVELMPVYLTLLTTHSVFCHQSPSSKVALYPMSSRP